MHIIFDQEQVNNLVEKYTILELDTFKILPQDIRRTAYAVIETVPLTEMPKIESLKNLHKNLMENYRRRDWNFCEQAIEQLTGAWAGELDSFYSEIQSRISNYKENDPGEAWDYTITRLQQ